MVHQGSSMLEIKFIKELVIDGFIQFMKLLHQLLKKFKHSSGEKRSGIEPILSQSAGIERSATLRGCALSFAKAISMGLRSGGYVGR